MKIKGGREIHAVIRSLRAGKPFLGGRDLIFTTNIDFTDFFFLSIWTTCNLII